jgi:hypothetical protein
MDYFIIEEPLENEWEVVADFKQSQSLEHSQEIYTELRSEFDEELEVILYKKESGKITFGAYEKLDSFSDDEFELVKNDICTPSTKEFMIEKCFKNAQIEIKETHDDFIYKTVESKTITDSMIAAFPDTSSDEASGEETSEKYDILYVQEDIDEKDVHHEVKNKTKTLKLFQWYEYQNEIRKKKRRKTKTYIFTF